MRGDSSTVKRPIRVPRIVATCNAHEQDQPNQLDIITNKMHRSLADDPSLIESTVHFDAFMIPAILLPYLPFDIAHNNAQFRDTQNIQRQKSLSLFTQCMNCLRRRHFDLYVHEWYESPSIYAFNPRWSISCSDDECLWSECHFHHGQTLAEAVTGAAREGDECRCWLLRGRFARCASRRPLWRSCVTHLRLQCQLH